MITQTLQNDSSRAKSKRVKELSNQLFVLAFFYDKSLLLAKRGTKYLLGVFVSKDLNRIEIHHMISFEESRRAGGDSHILGVRSLFQF